MFVLVSGLRSCSDLGLVYSGYLHYSVGVQSLLLLLIASCLQAIVE